MAIQRPWPLAAPALPLRQSQPASTFCFCPALIYMFVRTAQAALPRFEIWCRCAWWEPVSTVQPWRMLRRGRWAIHRPWPLAAPALPLRQSQRLRERCNGNCHCNCQSALGNSFMRDITTKLTTIWCMSISASMAAQSQHVLPGSKKKCEKTVLVESQFGVDILAKQSWRGRPLSIRHL